MNSKSESFLKRVALTGVILPFLVIGFIMLFVSHFKDTNHAVLLGSELGKYYFCYLVVLASAIVLWRVIEDLKVKKSR